MTTIVSYTAEEKVKISQEEYENAIALYDDRLIDDDCSDLLETIKAYENDEVVSNIKEYVAEFDIDYQYVYDVIFSYWIEVIKNRQGYSLKNYNNTIGFVCNNIQTFDEFSNFISSYESDPHLRYLIKKHFFLTKIKKYIKQCNFYRKLKDFKRVCNFAYQNYTNILQGRMVYRQNLISPAEVFHEKYLLAKLENTCYENPTIQHFNNFNASKTFIKNDLFRKEN